MTLQEYRKKQKKYHICRDCGNQDAFTLSGRTYCAECAAKQAAAKREQRAKDGGKKNQEACKKWRDKNIAEHKCVYCGRPLTENYKYKTCEYCRAKMRKRLEEKRRQDGVMTWDMRCSSDYCFQCGKNPPIEGGRLCEKCYEKKIKTCIPQFERMVEKGREITRKQNSRLFQKSE